MSYLVTAKQGGVQFGVIKNAKEALHTLPLGGKVVVDAVSVQLGNLKKAGMVAIRPATKGEENTYPRMKVEGSGN